jgi:hypothetical protein
MRKRMSNEFRVEFRRSNFRRSKQEIKSFYDQEIKLFFLFFRRSKVEIKI